MSSERGNIVRSRPQKHKNETAFKNNLHDTSHTIKHINNLEVNNVCTRCKSVIEWKIKYKKYKPLKAPSSCVKCNVKSVKHAYHTMCLPCAGKYKVCPKCGKGDTLVLSRGEPLLKTPEVESLLKSLPERRRRSFNRFVKKTLPFSTEAFKEDETALNIVLDKLKEMKLNSKKSDDLTVDVAISEDDVFTKNKLSGEN